MNNKNENSTDSFLFSPTINPKSQSIIGQKFQNSRMNVYERLHQDSKFKNLKIIDSRKESNASENYSKSNTFGNVSEPQSKSTTLEKPFNGEDTSKSFSKTTSNLLFFSSQS